MNRIFKLLWPRCLRCCLLSLFIIAAAAPSEAALVIDVSITGAGDEVDFSQVIFGITTVSGVSSLSFDTQVLDENLAANYIFAEDLDAFALEVLDQTNSEIALSDLTLNGNGVTVAATPSRLLARLEIQHTLGAGQTAALVVGDQFRVTLLATSTTLDDGLGFQFDTIFEDSFLDPVNVSGTSFNSITNGGLVTVQAATAVPEPGSFAVLSLAALGWLGRRRRQRKALDNSSSGSR